MTETTTATQAQEVGRKLADLATAIDGVAVYEEPHQEPGRQDALPLGYENLFKALVNAKPVLDPLDLRLGEDNQETIHEVFDAYRERIIESI